jgi:hypothetical protein
MMGFLANLFNRTLESIGADSWAKSEGYADNLANMTIERDTWKREMEESMRRVQDLEGVVKYAKSLNGVLRDRLDRIAATDKGGKMMRQHAKCVEIAREPNSVQS